MPMRCIPLMYGRKYQGQYLVAKKGKSSESSEYKEMKRQESCEVCGGHCRLQFVQRRVSIARRCQTRCHPGKFSIT